MPTSATIARHRHGTHSEHHHHDHAAATTAPVSRSAEPTRSGHRRSCADRAGKTPPRRDDADTGTGCASGRLPDPSEHPPPMPQHQDRSGSGGDRSVGQREPDPEHGLDRQQHQRPSRTGPALPPQQRPGTTLGDADPHERRQQRHGSADPPPVLEHTVAVSRIAQERGDLAVPSQVHDRIKPRQPKTNPRRPRKDGGRSGQNLIAAGAIRRTERRPLPDPQNTTGQDYQDGKQGAAAKASVSCPDIKVSQISV